MICRPATRDELVHDSALGANELIFGALTETGNLRRGKILECLPSPCDPQNRESGRDLHRSRGTQARAKGNIADQGEIETLRLDSGLDQHGKDADRIVGPMMRSALWERCQIEIRLLVKILRKDGDSIVRSRADCRQCGKVDGGGHDKAFRVIGVLSDEVHSSRREEDDRFRPVPLNVTFFGSVYIQHRNLIQNELLRSLRSNERISKGVTDDFPEESFFGHLSEV